ncbi:MAG TPA: peptide-methionine (S)-S-oxide reductase [Elusimicrobia bacterium]|nr:peptide-methionine (S)-S-oxide reductase [Elusimicrobiota bacterium]
MAAQALRPVTRSLLFLVLLAPSISSAADPEASMERFLKPSDDDLRRKLSSLQYEVTQRCGTEPPFKNEYWDEHRPGLYVDVATGEPLFSSLDKFDSGTGWPSFKKPLDAAGVVEKREEDGRTEVRSKRGGSHLGHVFPDGPKPAGLRYCINSAALRFVPAERLEAEGYGKYAPLFARASKKETAVLAGGCFWGMEEILRKLPGVLETVVGYTGGTTEKPTYEQVKTGATGHAESIQVAFDPGKISYEELLGTFFRMHDPTTPDRQGNDVGTQYRSAIFYTSEAQKKTAETVFKKVEASKKWKRPLTTKIVKAGKFWPAEDAHQDYLQKHPGGYSCHFLRD